MHPPVEHVAPREQQHVLPAVGQRPVGPPAATEEHGEIEAVEDHRKIPGSSWTKRLRVGPPEVTRARGRRPRRPPAAVPDRPSRRGRPPRSPGGTRAVSARTAVTRATAPEGRRRSAAVGRGRTRRGCPDCFDSRRISGSTDVGRLRSKSRPRRSATAMSAAAIGPQGLEGEEPRRSSTRATSSAPAARQPQATGALVDERLEPARVWSNW